MGKRAAPSNATPTSTRSGEVPLEIAPTLLLRGRPAPYHVRRSPRARCASLAIHPRRGLEVVLPANASWRLVTRVLAEKAAWLDSHADDILRATRPALPMRCGTLLPVRGAWRRLEVVAAPTPAVVPGPGVLTVYAPAPRAADDLRAQIEAWFRTLARRVILARVDALRSPRDRPVRAVRIRDQATRWGSCSGAGTLSFNWRLIMAPPPVLDAVIAHELTHLRLLNHSPRFWAELEARFPRHRQCQRWLDANGYRLGL